MPANNSKRTWPQRTGVGFRSTIRVIWTVITYPIVVVFGLVGGILGLFYGIGMGVLTKRGLWYGIRAGVLKGAIRGARMVFQASSWLYKSILFRSLYEDGAIPLPEVTEDLLIIGHRGAPYAAVENTISAFELAMKEGANALEIDLCLTRDGQIVVYHDWNPDDTVSLFREGGMEQHQGYKPVYPAGKMRRPVPELTLQELRRHYGFAKKDGTPVDTSLPKNTILTFREFLQWAARQKGLKAVFLDIKIPHAEPHWVEEMAPLIDDLLREFKPHYDVVLITPWRPVFEELKNFAPDLHISLDREVVSALPKATLHEARAFSAMLEAERYQNSHASVGRPTFLTLAPFEVYRTIILHDLRYRQEKDLPVSLIAWTINDSEELRELVNLGVDGILTDRPGRLVGKVLRRKTKEVLRSPRKLFRYRNESEEAVANSK